MLKFKKKDKEPGIVVKNEYYDKMHREGKIVAFIAIFLFLAIPFAVCLAYDIMPSISQILLASGALLAIFLPLGVGEVLAQVPIMGSTYYIASVTGNVLNLKIPAAINAQKIADVENGTEEADAIAGVAVTVSSLVTMLMLAVAVILLTPLKPFLAAPEVMTAAKYVLPSLFGCLVLMLISNDVGGGIIIKGRLKAALIPTIICFVLFFIKPDIYEVVQGIIIIIFLPIVYFTTKKMYNKGKIVVEIPKVSK
ncbi:MAG: hypothetical protein ACRCUS_02045 [Anaerovoracaceae bacterium]